MKPTALSPLEIRFRTRSLLGTLPDVAKDVKGELVSTLDRVGMSRIELPIKIKSPSGEILQVPATAEAYISLDDPRAKGIHMSRLFLIMQEILGGNNLNLETVGLLLKSFVTSHAEVSTSSFLKINFDYMVQRMALVSENWGWRKYPITVVGLYKEGALQFEIETEIAYSSTCPCSAALSRQLIQEDFLKHFPSEYVSTTEVMAWLDRPQVATPHSQRSYARVKMAVADTQNYPTFVQIIDLLEESLQTPVQAAVKREDEQEFARLNGSNLMFCEDAARRLKNALDQDKRISDYWVSVTHLESLHPHDAVAVVTKGKPQGFTA